MNCRPHVPSAIFIRVPPTQSPRCCRMGPKQARPPILALSHNRYLTLVHGPGQTAMGAAGPMRTSPSSPTATPSRLRFSGHPTLFLPAGQQHQRGAAASSVCAASLLLLVRSPLRPQSLLQTDVTPTFSGAPAACSRSITRNPSTREVRRSATAHDDHRSDNEHPVL